MIHRINVFLLSIFIIFSQTFIISTANAISWNGIKGVATAAGGFFTGSSTIGGATRTAAATVPWSSLKNGLGKGLGLGGNALLTAAVYAALSATDYVLDPANNSISYKPTVGGLCVADGSDCQAYEYIWVVADAYFGTPENACTKFAAFYSRDAFSYKNLGGGTYISNDSYDCNIQVKNTATGETWTEHPRVTAQKNVHYDPVAKPEEQQKTISLSDLIQKLIDQMNNNDAASKNVLDQILETSLAQAQSLENIDTDLKTMLAKILAALTAAGTYVTSNTGTGTITNPATGEKTDLSLDFPTFCGWAGIVCEAANTAINFPITVADWWKTVGSWHDSFWSYVEDKVTAVKEWVATETPADADTKVDIQEPDTTQMPTTNYFGWSAYCPFSKQSSALSINNQTSNLDSDLTSWCEMATEVRPFVIAAGALASLMIVSGISMRGDD